jgi:uncharacterized phiE125 gp8 family phage protein
MIEQITRQLAAPVTEPIDLGQVLDQTLAVAAGDDAYLEGLIVRARSRFEINSNRILVQQRWQVAQPTFEKTIRLPHAPVRSVQSVKYIDKHGVLMTIPSDDYRLVTMGLKSQVALKPYKKWPYIVCKQPDTVQIEYTVGHVLTDELGFLKDTFVDKSEFDLSLQAILILIAEWYKNREDSAPVQLYQVPNAYKALLSELKVDLL